MSSSFLPLQFYWAPSGNAHLGFSLTALWRRAVGSTISCSAWLSVILTKIILFFFFFFCRLHLRWKCFAPIQKRPISCLKMTRTQQWTGGRADARAHTHTHSLSTCVFFSLFFFSSSAGRGFYSSALINMSSALSRPCRAAAGSPSVVAGAITSRRLLSTCLRLHRTRTNHAVFAEWE